MANFLISNITFTVVLSSLLLSGNSQTFSTTSPRTKVKIGTENVTHLHFYFHDVVGGPNATTIIVARAAITNTSASIFGAVVVNDNLLTVGPEPSSTRVGRSQGIYAATNMKELSFTLVQNYVFEVEKYNGSTLCILGQNPITLPVRELPVVGGTGVFRFARGYAEARTFFLNATNGDAIVEYDVYIIH